MKMRTAVSAAMLALLMLLTADASPQSPSKAATLAIAGHPGEAPLVQIGGKSYVEIEALARLTKGSLSFKANQTILTLLPPETVVPTVLPTVLPAVSPAAASAATPPAKPGLSRAFIQAGIEELGVIREWRTAIVDAVQKNTPVPDDWVAARRRLADKNLALASAAASTDDDRSAYPLLATELSNMQKLSDLYLAMRAHSAFISPDTFGNGPLEQQILSCAQGFASMSENHEFQDQPACH
jgi:hypothetical protein